MQYGLPDPRVRFRNHGIFAPIVQPPDDEALTGWVMGKEASDLEERFYREARADSRTSRIMFRRVFGAPARSMFGAIELDFLVVAGATYAVAIDADRFHQTAAAIVRDQNQDDRLIGILRYFNVSRVHHIQQKHLANPEKAARTWEQLIGGRIFTKWS